MVMEMFHTRFTWWIEVIGSLLVDWCSWSVMVAMRLSYCCEAVKGRIETLDFLIRQGKISLEFVGAKSKNT